ncbi:hypothetical protein [Rhodovibrio sodomensis]|uniref:hypothetical protein n=1 Tax=Rhodovibrio sodomensis TaxID=1088 RepID=UPI001F5B2E26|nr:hypothetical protein [Rhodovibrio sodomensis]
MTAGTPLHRTRVPLTKWFLAIWLISTSSKGISGIATQSRVSARKLAEWLDIDDRTAWYMDHRIRRLLADPDWRKLSGMVEANGHAVGAPRQMYDGGRKNPEDDDPGSAPAARGGNAAPVARWFWSPQSVPAKSGSGGSRRTHRSRSATLGGS